MFDFLKKKKKPIDEQADDDLLFEDGEFDNPFGDMDETSMSPKEKFLKDLRAGAKEHIKSRDFFKTILTGALPEEINEVIDFAESVEGDIKNSFANATNEVKPKLQSLRKSVIRATPKNFSFFSKSLQEKIEAMRQQDIEDDKANRVVSKGEEEENSIQSDLRSIFSAQTEAVSEQMAIEQTERFTDRAATNKRFKITTGISTSIANDIARLTSYTTSVTHKYHMKSLEVSHRQLFVLRDILNLTKTYSSNNKTNLDKLVSLAALPNEIKLRKYEQDKVNRLSLFTSYSTDKVLSSFREKLGKGTKELVSRLGEGLGLIEPAFDMANSGMGPGIGSMIGSGITGFLAKKATDKFGKGLREKVAGTALGNKADDIIRGFSDLPSFFSDLATGAHTHKMGEGGILKDVGFGILKSFMPKQEEGTQLGVNTMAGLGEAFKYTRRTDITLNEVIPGLLSRIELRLRLLQNPKAKNTELLAWSYQSNSFSNDKALTKELEASIVSGANQSWGIVNQTDDFIDKGITHAKSGMGTLAADAPERLALRKLILEGTTKSKRLNPEELLEGTNTGKKLLVSDPELYEKVKQLLSQSTETMSSGRYRNTTKAYYDLSGRIPDITDQMRLQLDAGQLNNLKKIGIVIEKNGKLHFSKDRYLEMLTDAGRGKEKEKTGFESLGRAFNSMFGSVDLDDPYKGSMDHVPGTAILNHEEGSGVEKDTKPEKPKPTILERTKELGSKAVDALASGYEDITNRLTPPDVSKRVTEATKSVMAYIESHTPEKLKQATNSLIENPPKPKELGNKIVESVKQLRDKTNARFGTPTEAIVKAKGLVTETIDKVKSGDIGVDKLDDLRRLYRTKVEELGAIIKTARESKTGVDVEDKLKTLQGSIESLAGRVKTQVRDFSNKEEVKTLVDGLLDRVTDYRAKFMTGLEAGLKAAGEVNKPAGSGMESVDNKTSGIKDNIRNLGGGKIIDLYENLKSKKTSITDLSGQIKDMASSTKIGKKLEESWDMIKYKDVYILGRPEPILTADGFKHGEYYNSDGEPIKTQDDIDGLVRNADGDVLVTAEQVEKLIVYEKEKNGFIPLNGLRKLFKGLAAIQRFGNKAAAFNIKMLWKGFKFAGRTLGRMVGMYTQPRDVYVEGESEPRMTTYGFKAGDYYDIESGKKLKNHEEICGSVCDKDGRILLTVEELDKLAIYEPFLSKMNPLKLGKWVIGKIASASFAITRAGANASRFLLKKLFGGISKVARAGVRLAGGVAGALGLRMQPTDIYVAGEERPRLIAVKMKKGDYVNLKTGTTINYPGDIEGDVVDATDPNADLVLSKEDIEKGIYSKDGVRINPRGGVLGSISTRLAKLFGVKKKLTIKSKHGVAKSLKTGVTIGEEAQVKSAETLTDMSGVLKGIAAKLGVRSKKERVVKKIGKDKPDDKNVKTTPSGKESGGKSGLSNVAKGLLPLISELALPVLGIMGAAAAGLGIGTFIGKKVSGAIGDVVDGAKSIFGMETPEEELNRITLGPDQNDPENVKRAKILRSKIMSTPEGRKKLTGDPNGRLPASSLPARDPNARLDGMQPTPQRQPVTPTKGGSIFGSNANAGELPNTSTPTLDGEPTPSAGGGGGGSPTKPASVGSLPVTPGPLTDGRNADSFLKQQPGVKQSGVNPQYMAQFKGAVEEYGEATGKKVVMTDGFRTYQDQVAMKAKYGDGAASPGNSPHEAGLAIDADRNALNQMDKMGILRKYGITRPISGEPWHTEPIGILGKVKDFKNNPEAATEAIKSGIGRGGGGLGAGGGGKKFSRDYNNALSVYSAPSTVSKELSEALKSPVKGFSTTPGYFPTGQTTPNGPTMGGQGQSQTSYDNESKPVTASGGSTPPVQTEDAKKIVEYAAKTVGVDPGMMKLIGAMESGLGKNAGKASTSSASGMFQITGGTWKEMLKKYGGKYGYDITTPTSDTKASALMAAHYVKELSGSLPKGAGARDVYMSYMLGPGGSKTLRSADPSSIAAELLPSAASANDKVFYVDGDKSKPRTVLDLQKFFDSKMAKAGVQYGIAVPAMDMSSQQAPQVAQQDTIQQRQTTPYNRQYTETSRQARFSEPTQSPMTRVSYQPQTTTYDTQSRGSPENMMNPALLKRTETLLAEQLSVQKQILEMLKGMSVTNSEQPQESSEPQVVNAKSQQGGGGQQQPGYKPPSPAIPMTRRYAT